jgi:uncharacterized ferritin-like protein (DUF455 family)
MPATSLFQAAADALKTTGPTAKCEAAQALVRDLEAGRVSATGRPVAVDAPGLPERPELVHPRSVPRRKLSTAEGHAALIHAVTHIEFSAINLALDAAARFGGMPREYYADWVRVAAEEAEHYTLISEHLQTLGWSYGDFSAHAGLWEAAAKTADDPLKRMALVPRVMEARGLDVTPDMIVRLRGIGDEAGARILERILADEIGHVAIGSRWFGHLCEARGLDPETTFQGLISAELGGLRGGECNREARLAAGFSEAELASLFPTCA